MLKLAMAEEERAGSLLLAWWVGNGAARVLSQGGPALLKESRLPMDAQHR